MVVRLNVSAPGKVILHGEHSVVYGKPAIAGVVQVRNDLTFQETPETTKITVEFYRLGLTFELNNTALNDFVKSLSGKIPAFTSPKDLDHTLFMELLNQFYDDQFKEKNYYLRERNSILSFLYLLAGKKILFNATDPTPAFQLFLETEMSIGAGLGSSASFGVCLAGAFVFWMGSLRNPNFVKNFNDGSADRDQVLQEVSDWAFCAEKIAHGNPSGLDNMICTVGNVVKFYRGQLPETISLGCPIPVLLVDSNVSRSTATLVQKVVQLKEKHPAAVQSIFDAMGHVVDDAVEILKTIKEDDAEKFKELQCLVAMNNNLLRAIDVSHPQLERIFATADKHGFKAKLSGAGGGGFAIILLSEEEQKGSQYAEMKRELEGLQFELTETKLGGPGLEVISF